jgi:anti-sigma factor RsiW
MKPKKFKIKRVKLPGDKITCKQVTSLILDYLSGELSRQQARTFELHLFICPDCVAFLNTYKKTVEATGILKYAEVPADLRRRVREYLKKKMKNRPAGR